MREDDGIELLLERVNFLGQRIKLLFGHCRARLHFCDINHGEKLPPPTGVVNEGRQQSAWTLNHATRACFENQKTLGGGAILNPFPAEPTGKIWVPTGTGSILSGASRQTGQEKVWPGRQPCFRQIMRF